MPNEIRFIPGPSLTTDQAAPCSHPAAVAGPPGSDGAIGADAVQTTIARAIGDGPGDVDRGRLRRLLDHHFAARGGEVRTRLTLDMAQSLQLDRETATLLAAATELLHNASLIHDDLQDGDTDRRGAPALWVAFGPAAAICAGDALIVAAFRTVAGLQDAQAIGPVVTALSQAVETAVRGQLVDIGGQGDGPLPLARYRALVAAKSGALLALPIHLPLIAAGQADRIPATEPTVTDLALAYQIADDLADVARDGRVDPARDPAAAKGISILDVADLRRFAEAEGGHHLPSTNGGTLDVQVGQAAALARAALDRVEAAARSGAVPVPCAVLAPVVEKLRRAVAPMGIDASSGAVADTAVAG